MPISLPAISRRRFLARSLAAGVGLALGRSAFAFGKSTDAHTWALLADVHVAANRTHVKLGVNMADNFIAVARELAALPKRPAGVIINGDLALQEGEPGDYATFSDLLQPIRAAKLPIHLTLGNHDHRGHFLAALGDKKIYPGPVVEKYVTILKTRLANWFLLDSLEKVAATPGELGDEQRFWLAAALDSNRGKPAVVVAHHNLQQGGKLTGLKDTEKFLEVMSPRKQVKTFIYGHTHNWNIRQLENGIHLINLPPVAYVFTEGKPSGWVQATLRRDGARLELHCLDKSRADNGQVVDLKWRAS